ncbi:MAG: class I SAM-dependent methyltransferase [Gemmatimonadetes bacterium]|nr:class I SAM-dependent methyltransferase [Gemmatimonadota bacterium]
MNRDVIEMHARVEREHWWFEGRRRILRAIADATVPQGHPLRVVDIGCGLGATLTAFRDRYECVGYDPNSDAIEFGRVLHPDFDLRIGTAADAASDIERASVVLLNDVIEHVPDDRALVQPMVTAMAPGNLLIITVPADMRLWSPHDVALGHYRRYDEDTLSLVWEGLPVRVRLLSRFNARLYPIIRVVRSVARVVGRSSGGAGTDLQRPTPGVNRLLTWLFAGERRRLLTTLTGRGTSYRQGVSLLAVLERTASSS